MRWTLLALAVSCYDSPWGEGCLDNQREAWCHHDTEIHGEPGCLSPLLPPEAEADGSCKDYVLVPVEGFEDTAVHYFNHRGKHVATQYTTDEPVYCGDLTYWYGRRVNCGPPQTASVQR